MSERIYRPLRTAQYWMKWAVWRLRRAYSEVGESTKASLRRSEPAFASKPELDEQFRTLALAHVAIGVATKLALADGDINEAELSALEVLFPVPEGERTFHQLLLLAQSDTHSHQHYTRQVLRLGSPAVAENMLRRLCQLAEADSRAVQAELDMLEDIAQMLNLAGKVELFLSSTFTGEASPHRLLKIAPSATQEAIKQAYRSRMRELHPDSLTAAGYSAEDIARAGKELLAVNDAYQQLMQRRKIK